MFDYQEVQMKENNIKENDFFFSMFDYILKNIKENQI